MCIGNEEKAFPEFRKEYQFEQEYLTPIGGLTMRDYFAAAALSLCTDYNTYNAAEHIAADAYKIADAMLKISQDPKRGTVSLSKEDQ